MPFEHEAVKVKDDSCDTASVTSGELHVRVGAVIPGVGTTNLGKAEDSVHADGDVGILSLAVRQDAAAALAANGDYIPLIVDASGRLHIAPLPAGTSLIGLVQPFAAVSELGLTELIGTDERVDQNEYSGSVGIALGGTYSGEILHVTLYTYETGAGAILTPEGTLMVFDADPTITAGDAAMTAGERQTIIGQIEVSANDWKDDASGASVTVQCQPIAFHALATLYFVWFHEDATSFNDNAGDDEAMTFNAWIRRDS